MDPVLARTAAPRVEAPEAQAPEARSWWDALSSFLEERNIRWFHTLGALLFLAACIGFLQATWSTVGRQVVSVGLVLSPFACFAGAARLRQSLPLSSRLLALLGGLLFPTGLGALNRFHVLGLDVPADNWSALVFGASAVLLGVMAVRLEEVTCLYLGTLSLGLGAFFAGRASHLPWQLFGPAMLGAAFGYLYLGWQGRWPVAELFRPHLLALSQAMAALGLISTLPGFLQAAGEGERLALVAFFLGSVFFASAGYLFGRPQALLASGAVATAGAWLGAPALGLGWPACAYPLLGLGLFYLAASMFLEGRPGLTEQDRAMAENSTWMAVAVPGATLAALAGREIFLGAWTDFAALPPGELGSSLVVSLLAAALYAAIAWLRRRPAVLYAATAALAYAWFLGAVLSYPGRPDTHALSLASLPLAWLGLAALGQRRLPEVWQIPLVNSALALAALPGPLALQAWGLGTGDDWNLPRTLLLCGLAYFFAWPWLRQAGWLYLGLAFLSAGYGLALPLAARELPLLAREFNLGLYYVPLAAALALAGKGLENRREMALPVVRTTLALALMGSLAQAFYWLEGFRATVALALAAWTGGLLLAGRLYRSWTWLGRPAQEGLACWAGLLLPGAWLAASGPGVPASGLGGVLALSALMVAAWALLPEGPPPHPWRAACHWSALVWSALAALLLVEVEASPGHTLLAWAPGMVWVVAALIQRGGWPWVGLCSPALTLWGLAVDLLDSRDASAGAWALLLGLQAAAYAWEGWRRDLAGGLVLAWATAGLAWLLGLAHLDLAEAHQIYAWWPFNLLVALAARGLRPLRPGLSRAAEGCALATAGLVLGLALFPEGTFLWTGLVYGAALAAVGWGRPSPLYWMGGWLCLAAAGQWELYRQGQSPGALGLVSAAVALAALGAGQLLTGPRRAVLRSPSLVLAALLAGWASLAGGLGAWGQQALWGQAALGAATAAWTLRGRLEPGRANYHLAFLSAYLLYLTLLRQAGLESASWVSTPVALWVLYWSHVVGQEEGRPRTRAATILGLLLLFTPPLASSLKGGAGPQALVVMGLGLAVLLTGVALRHREYVLGSSLALLLEAGIQVLQVAMRSWPIVAALSGALLVCLGVLFERKRLQLLRAGRRLFDELASW
jgi:hypothetical protein